MTESMKLVGSVCALLLLGLVATASAQSSAGQDGVRIYYGSGGATSWTNSCNKVRFPAGATSAKVLITGTNTVCSGGVCSNAGGDGDMYVYASTSSATTKPAHKAAGYLGAAGCTGNGTSCGRPYQSGNEENTLITVSTSADTYVWACVDPFSNFTEVQLRAEFNLGNATGTSSSGGSGTAWWLDIWKNNLFLSMAHHRFGCMASSVAIVDEREYDGFTLTDYCRVGGGLTDPATRGGTSSYQTSIYFGGDPYWTWQNTKNALESYGSTTNTTYGTASYARRSTSCGYNILMNCNSDCWMRKYYSTAVQPTCTTTANCTSGTICSAGKCVLDIASPCW